MMPNSRDAFVAAVGGTVAVASSFAVAGRTPSFVGAGIDRLVTMLVPGVVMGTTIDALGDTAHLLAFGFALVVALALFSGVTYAAILATKRSEVPFTGVIAATGGGWLTATVLTGAFKDALFVGGAMGVVLAVAEYRWKVGRDGPGSRGPSLARRRVVATLLGVVGFSWFAYLRGRRKVGAREGPISSVTNEEVQASAEEAMTAAAEQSFDVVGLDGLVTPTDGFYQVDKNAVDPNPSAGLWNLHVTGAVDEELEIGYDELTGMEIDHRFVTLRCVGESLNGEKMDTALWTGIPIERLLERAGIPDECCVMLHADDGYYEEFPLSALRDGFLAFGMNGTLLPRKHGYPVRALVPGHWGEINVKWLTEIEVLEEEAEGFWEKKGWHGTGPVETVAKLHVENHLDGGVVQLAGHAYTGTRGISRVEVSADDGRTWENADLGPKLPGKDVWRQWKFQWKPRAGKHDVLVRAVDGDGTVQPDEFRSAYPNGPAGWVSRTIEV
jgi:DMSO/TMAO reductase YedYZ molybdopterin-dependent catalytic subunit